LAVARRRIQGDNAGLNKGRTKVLLERMLLETDKAGGDRQRLDRAGKAAAKVA